MSPKCRAGAGRRPGAPSTKGSTEHESARWIPRREAQAGCRRVAGVLHQGSGDGEPQSRPFKELHMHLNNFWNNCWSHNRQFDSGKEL